MKLFINIDSSKYVIKYDNFGTPNIHDIDGRHIFTLHPLIIFNHVNGEEIKLEFQEELPLASAMNTYVDEVGVFKNVLERLDHEIVITKKYKNG